LAEDKWTGLSDRRNLADNLMAGHERIEAGAPIIIDEVEIAVADSTMRNLDLHVLRSKRSRLVLVRYQRLLGRGCREGGEPQFELITRGD